MMHSFSRTVPAAMATGWQIAQVQEIIDDLTTRVSKLPEEEPDQHHADHPGPCKALEA